MRYQLKSRGFTLVELLVVAPILMVTIVVMMSFLFNQLGQLTQEGARIRLVTDAQAITFSMQDDLLFASNFNSEINPGLEDTHAPDGGWDYNTTPETLIVSVPALTTSNRDANREVVYIDSVGCDDSVVEENGVLLNNVIFFIEGTNLYKRTVSAPESVATCGESYEKQTCPTDYVTEDCPKDVLLSDKLDSFSVVYFDNENNEIAEPDSATAIRVTISLKDRAFAEDVFGESSITLRRLNT